MLSTEDLIKIEEIFSVVDHNERELKRVGNALKDLNDQIRKLREQRDSIESEKATLVASSKKSIIDLEIVLRKNNIERDESEQEVN